tara:strand:- start:268 stop:405 length:138 start_codon:yes stop_codon:yes gene_type:complete
MDFEKIYLDQNEFIEEVLLCNYPHLSIQDIQEMDIDEKRMLIGWD